MVRIGERMTEKRFYLDENGINDKEYEFSIISEEELVDRINELNDENKELKEENEQLKKRCNEYWEEAGLNNDYYD